MTIGALNPRSWAAIPLLMLFVVPGLRAQGAQDTGASSPRGPQYLENLRRWQSLTEEQRQALRGVATNATPEQVEQLRQKLAQLKRLPGKEQERVRDNYRRFDAMVPAARKMLAVDFGQWQALPEERKDELRRRVRTHVVEPATSGESSPALRPDTRPKGAREGAKGQGGERRGKPEGLNEDPAPQPEDLRERPEESNGGRDDGVRPLPDPEQRVRPEAKPSTKTAGAPQGRNGNQPGTKTPVAKPGTSSAQKRPAPARPTKGTMAPRPGGIPKIQNK